MVKDAESHAEEDRSRRELIDVRNQAENLMYETEKNLKEWGEKVDSATRSRIEGAISKLREAAAADTPGPIRTAVEALQKELHALAAEMYKHADAAGPQGPDMGTGPGPTPGEGAGGGPVDAEYEIVDEDKKKS
jgi:molecular chaperone DnaK